MPRKSLPVNLPKIDARRCISLSNKAARAVDALTALTKCPTYMAEVDEHHLLGALPFQVLPGTQPHAVQVPRPPWHVFCADEVNALVVDLGSCLCKIGYGGDDTPKAFFPSVSCMRLHAPVSFAPRRRSCSAPACSMAVCYCARCAAAPSWLPSSRPGCHSWHSLCSPFRQLQRGVVLCGVQSAGASPAKDFAAGHAPPPGDEAEPAQLSAAQRQQAGQLSKGGVRYSVGDQALSVFKEGMEVSE